MPTNCGTRVQAVEPIGPQQRLGHQQRAGEAMADVLGALVLAVAAEARVEPTVDVDQAVVEDVLDLMGEREALTHHGIVGTEYHDPAIVGLGGHAGGRQILAARDAQPRQAGQVAIIEAGLQNLEFAAQAVGLALGHLLSLADAERALGHDGAQTGNHARGDVGLGKRHRLAQSEQRQALIVNGLWFVTVAEDSGDAGDGGHGVPPVFRGAGLAPERWAASSARISARACSRASMASGESFSLLRR